MRRTLTRRFVLGASAGLMAFPAQAAPGHIVTVAGTGAQGFAADGESVKTAKLDQPFGVLFGPDGDGAHAEVEWVSLAGTVGCAQTLTAAALSFCRDPR